MQRTATAAQPGKDFTTWDLPRLFAEIDKQFQKALAADKILKATPISAWNDLLQKGTMPDSYRPTLYDFIAYQALEFYTSGEQAAAKPEDAFELSADSPILDSAEKFLAWKPRRRGYRLARCSRPSGSTRTCSVSTRVTRAALAFGGRRPGAADLGLEHCLRRGQERPVTRRPWRPSSAPTRTTNLRPGPDARRGCCSRRATSWQRASSPCAARADVSGITRAASSAATWLLRSRPSRPLSLLSGCGIVAQASRPQALPHCDRPYRNVEVVYFRAIPADWEMFLEKRHHRPENLNDKERREILARKPALEWSAKLPPTTDYKEKTFETPAPDSLKPGYISSPPAPTEVRRGGEHRFHHRRLGERPGTGDADRDGRSRLRPEGRLGRADSGAEVAVWHLDNQGNRVADPTLHR